MPARRWASSCGLDEERILAEVMVRGRLGDVPGVPEEVRRPFVTALDIPAERHLQIQAAFQRHVDNAVSKTVNLPHESTRDAVADAFRRAWRLGLKGITVYRLVHPRQGFVVEVSPLFGGIDVQS